MKLIVKILIAVARPLLNSRLNEYKTSNDTAGIARVERAFRLVDAVAAEL